MWVGSLHRAMAEVPGAPSIETCPRPSCPACGSPGQTLYDAVTDLLFGAWGTWRLRACSDDSCGTVWPDPSPSPAGLPAAYARYYTHDAGVTERAGPVAAAFRLLWRITGLAAERAALRRMTLDGVRPGRLLDVGCGDGRRLADLESLGWSVEGQEVDAAAVDAARRAGRRVHLGALEALQLSAGAYDAITMNHVIEHVHEPVALLAECRRLLAPGGRVVALTPNAASTGHRRYGLDWRGLEPPRHLQVFTPRALAAVAERAGFSHVDVRTSAANAYTFAVASQGIAAARLGRPFGFAASRLGALRFQWSASRAFAADFTTGEECLLMAVA